MDKKCILLTGASGEVGRLLRPLLRPAYLLRLCDLAPIDDPAPGEELVQGDLADPAVARRAVEGVGGVVHLAALVAPAVSFEDTLGPNYRALLVLLEACRHSTVRRFVFASTHHVLGLHPLRRTSLQTPVAPDSFYGLSKVFGEGACALYAHRFGIATLIIRIGNVTPMVTDGRRERLWVSDRDLARLITIGLERPGLGCETVSGTSDCPEAVFENTEALRLGYSPLDQAAKHHAPTFRSLPGSGDVDGSRWIGGAFAVNPLPDPLKPRG